MKRMINLLTGLIISLSLFAQENQVKELISQGVQLHDEGKYEEAIVKYKAALDLDKNSSLAIYELSYSYLANKQYKKAISCAKKVIALDQGYEESAYVVIGNALDMSGNPTEAIRSYESGLEGFPESNLLNYNLALTCYNQKDYERAEEAAINAISSKPSHGSSHLILSSIMQAKGKRVKSILPVYYFLMLEPDSRRSLKNLRFLLDQLGKGVEKKDEKTININIPSSTLSSDDFDPAEFMISMAAASKYSEPNKDKSDMNVFMEINRSLFGILGELKKENKGFWWNFYVTTFYDLVNSDNWEAFSYYIAQSSGSEEVKKWIDGNPEKMEKFKEWMERL